MTYDDDVLRRLAAADPVPVDTEVPLTASPGVLLDRVTEQMAAPTRTRPLPQPGPSWRGPVVGAAAFVAVFVIGAAIVLGDGGGEVELVASTTVPPTTIATTTTTPPTTTSTTTTITNTAPLPPFGSTALSLSFVVQDGFDSLGTFTATGPAVDDGYFCPSGTSYETDVQTAEPGTDTESWTTHMICGDRSGKLKLVCDSVGEMNEEMWVANDTCAVADGEDAYLGVVGHVEGVTTCDGTTCTVEYTGEIRIDG